MEADLNINMLVITLTLSALRAQARKDEDSHCCHLGWSTSTAKGHKRLKVKMPFIPIVPWSFSELGICFMGPSIFYVNSLFLKHYFMYGNRVYVLNNAITEWLDIVLNRRSNKNFGFANTSTQNYFWLFYLSGSVFKMCSETTHV